MNNDHELLELAARAASIEWYGFYGDAEVECQYLDIGEDDVIEWNPLTDDGDCARLEAELGICIEWWSDSVCCTVGNGSSWTEVFADHKDKNAARRYSSTTLAAAIGKEMK